MGDRLGTLGAVGIFFIFHSFFLYRQAKNTYLNDEIVLIPLTSMSQDYNVRKLNDE